MRWVHRRASAEAVLGVLVFAYLAWVALGFAPTRSFGAAANDFWLSSEGLQECFASDAVLHHGVTLIASCY